MRYKNILFMILGCLLLWARPAAAQPETWLRIGLAVDQPELTISLEGSEQLFDAAESQPQPLDLPGDKLVVNLSGETMFVNNIPVGKGPLVLVPGAALLTWNSRNYRGEFLISGTNGKLTLINRLPLEDYLRGVLPKEVTPSWPLAALKAQAIAARTYAITSLNRHGGSGFDLCTTVHCQAYGGASAEQSGTDEAVAETDGEILTYKGKPVTAYYHSDAGGYTSDAASIWGGGLPYLKAVPDWDQNSPRQQWLKVYNWVQLQAAAAAAYPKIGRLYRITPVSFSNDGRLLNIILKGDLGDVTITGEQFRLWIGLPSSQLQLGVVYGPDPLVTLWWVHHNPVPEAMVASNEIPGLNAELINPPWDLWDPYLWLQDKEPCKVVLRGMGSGHGVGLSQWGAKGMADVGFDERQILQHYFPGTELTKLAD